ncbi:MAG: PIN domain-containing protein [Chloroflexi bacterium]|nr:PIN domain-containing protein [Chloroflexota bacterium]
MPAFGIKLADANVWLAFAADGHTHHAQAREWLNAQADESCAVCRVTQMALLRHLTNSKIMGENVQTQVQAWQTYDKLASDARVVYLEEPAALAAVFRSFTQEVFPAHERWSDAYLAAFAVVSHSQLVTFDHGFRRFAGLDLLVLDT